MAITPTGNIVDTITTNGDYVVGATTTGNLTVDAASINDGAIVAITDNSDVPFNVKVTRCRIRPTSNVIGWLGEIRWIRERR